MKKADEETIYHVKCATINGGKCRDFVFLLSKRQPCKNGWDFASTKNTVSVSSLEFIWHVFYRDRDPYVIAIRSVTVATVPPEENSIRSEAKCAGFLIHRIGHSTCKVPPEFSEAPLSIKKHGLWIWSLLLQVTYYNQVTSGVLPYIEGSLEGWSKSMEETGMSCISFLEQDLLTTVFWKTSSNSFCWLWFITIKTTLNISLL